MNKEHKQCVASFHLIRNVYMFHITATSVIYLTLCINKDYYKDYYVWILQRQCLDWLRSTV